MQRTLASITPFFAIGSHTTKVHINELSEWLLNNVELEDVLSSSYKGFGAEALKPKSEHITYLNKCITIKDASSLAPNIDVKVMNCEESYIYIDQSVDCLLISQCSNCTVFCAAVRRVATISNCENVTVTVAAGCVRVGNCIDCTVHTYSHLGSPIVYGDTRNLLVAPHNAGYTDLTSTLARGGINLHVPNLTERVFSFMSPTLMHVPKEAINFMQPLDFMRLSLPKQFGKDDKLILCP